MAYVGRAAPKLYFDAFVKDTFDGDGTTTSFTLSKTPGNVNSLLVAVDNVIQEPGVAFTLSDNTLTFTGAPSNGSDNIYACFWGGTLTIAETSTVKTSNSATITGNLVPTANVVFSLGEPGERWKDLYLGANSLHLGNVSIGIGKTGEVEFMKTNKLGQPVTSVDVANVHASIDSGAGLSFYSANTTGNVRFARGAAIGYANSKVPGANLDVKNNVFIGGQTSISGDVGIGLTGTPIGPLQIYHATTPRIFLTNSTSGSGSTNDGTMFDHTGSDTMISNNSNGGIIFRANQAEGMRLTTTGLGIVATPDRKFNVNSGGVGFIATLTDGVATNFTFKTATGGIGTFGTEAGSTQLALMVAGTERARLNGSGDLAIGNLSPGKQFNVTKAAMANVATQAYGANTQLNMDTAQNFTTTLTGNIVFSNPTNVVGGQTGSIFIRQDGTGSRTASWGTHWHFAGGTAPTLTTTAKAIDRIDYITCNAVCVMAVASLDVKVGS